MVYLVDDDQDDLKIVQEALAENNYTGPVLPLANGRLLLNQLTHSEASARPSVIILDLNMPLLDGFEVLQELRKHPSLREIPVIVLTASSKKEDEIRAFELGCNFFITKPSKISGYLALTAAVKKFVSAAA